MGEKVLGFKKKDGRFNNGYRKDVVFVNDWIIAQSKFVPVVSVKWLEKWANKNMENRTIGFGEDEQIVTVNDLLSAVRKEASK